MIEINLLPPEHRPVERTPLPRLLTILVGVLMTMVGLVFWATFTFVWIPSAKRLLNEARQSEVKKRKQRQEVEEIIRTLEVYTKRETTLRNLYMERLRWTRILDRLADARKAAGDVVIIELEVKKSTGVAGPARMRAQTRELHVKGYVPSLSEDPVPAHLTKPYYAMVNFLKDDPVWKEMFGVKKVEDKKEVLVVEPDYRSMRVKLSMGTSRLDDEEGRNLPKSALEFHVVFTFTPLEPKKRPGTGPAPPPGGTAVAGNR
ncbi:MAG: PilN domain-containing protein [Planctomycetota bacterium]|jgi:hypothetical protein